MLVRLQVFSLPESVIDWWAVGVTADISPGASPRKSKPVDIDGRARGRRSPRRWGRRDGWPSDYRQPGGQMETAATFNKLLEAGGRAGLMVLKRTRSTCAVNQRPARAHL